MGPCSTRSRLGLGDQCSPQGAGSPWAIHHGPVHHHQLHSAPQGWVVCLSPLLSPMQGRSSTVTPRSTTAQITGLQSLGLLAGPRLAVREAAARQALGGSGLGGAPAPKLPRPPGVPQGQANKGGPPPAAVQRPAQPHPAPGAGQGRGNSGRAGQLGFKVWGK